MFNNYLYEFVQISDSYVTIADLQVAKKRCIPPFDVAMVMYPLGASVSPNRVVVEAGEN